MRKVLAFVTLSMIASAPALSAIEQQKERQERDKRLRQEDSSDYFKKWLHQDVRYIISDEEKAIFQELSTEEEKEQFIEQFWRRRDPNPRSSGNEFKMEHYRRIAYANERFASGIAGWKTDRGRVYIIQGPPDQIVSYPSGGPYLRQSHEGGGQTSTFPFEVWRYRQIDGLGSEVELEFVDRTWAGEYRLTMNPDEKDTLMRVPSAGPTLAELTGASTSKRDRPFFQPGNTNRYPFRRQRVQDSPFAKYELVSRVQSPGEIQYKDLQEVVKVRISYENDIRFQVRQDLFHLNQAQVLAPVTVEVLNRQLTFAKDDGPQNVGRLAVYGIVTRLDKRIVDEFDDDLAVAASDERLEQTMASRSIYQRLLILERGTRYKLDLVLKDVNSGKIGYRTVGIQAPEFDESKLGMSSLVISDMIVPAPAESDMFVLGDLKVRPRPSNSFNRRNGLGLYVQLYNLGVDQSSRMPSMEARYRILREGKTVIEMSGERGQGVRLYSDQRAVLVKTLPVGRLQPGRYELQVEIHDRIRDEVSKTRQVFHLHGSEARGTE